MSRYYLTTAIDYVNSRPHLGTAYEKVTADVIARYQRLRGVETHFLMGNDEHSQNVHRRATELGLDPLTYCDQMEEQFRAVWAGLDISFDDFIRTTERRHREGVTKLVRAVERTGDLYEGFYEGWYCVSCEAFKQEKDLIDGNCPLHNRRPDWIRERNYFFRMSRYRQALLDHFESARDFLQPDVRRNEILRLLEGGLEDVSITRSGQAWGIPMPDDPSSVVYVWFDALINYISAVGYGSDDALFARWWPAAAHIVGKDITRFHCVVWPAMLLSAGLPLPHRVFGHGWVHLKGQRMSKSLGTVLDPLEVSARLGPDPLRLYLVKEIAYGQDGDFSWERFEERYNVDLANNLGNLVSRVAAMAARYRQGRLRPPAGPPGRLAAVASEAVARYDTAMGAFALHEAAAAAFAIVDAANEFIAESEPWVLARDPDQAGRLDQVLFEAAEAVRIVAVLLLPVMPRSAAEILDRVGETRAPADWRLDDLAAWSAGGERTISQRPALWPRVDPPVTAAEETSMTTPESPDRPPPPIPTGSSPSPAPASPTPAGDASRISIDQFMAVDLRVAKVVAAERVPNSRKLIKLEVDLGTERRTLVAGIAEVYEAPALVGRTVVVVANLEPAKLMGIESNGMVLAASLEGNKPRLVGFEAGDGADPPPPGTRVR